MLSEQLDRPCVLGKISCFALAIAVGVSIFLFHPAYGHFYGGQTDTFGNYSILCVPAPDPPVAKDNNTKLQFSVLFYGDNIYNIASSLTLKDKDTGAVVTQTPVRPYEFSDITIPVVFPKPGNYVATLATTIVGDQNYSNTPLVANFDVSAMDPSSYVPVTEIILMYVIPPVAVASGVIGFLIYCRKSKLFSGREHQ